ncbi:MAG: hypothetical protein QE263_03850 [Vampirovibrionales bacterium]|nr:hypothetical protein [Vampirovibrionales bacterium]
MKRAFALAAIVSTLSVSAAFAADTLNPTNLNSATVQQALQMLNSMTMAPPTTTSPTTTTSTVPPKTTTSPNTSSSISINGLAGSLLNGQPVITQLQTENSLLKEQVVGLYTMQIKGVDMEMTALKSKLENLTTQKASLEKSLQTLAPSTPTVK